MNKVKFNLSAILMSVMMLSSCGGGDSKEEGGDSKEELAIKEVTIGKQVWMAENLNVDKFLNGDLIPEAKTDEEWIKAGKERKPAWCYYNNDPDNGAKYGKIYNWYAVNDNRGLAPKGWHVPSDVEWKELNEKMDVVQLKSTSGWGEISFHNGNNESGFSAVPGGERNEELDGQFAGLGEHATWWTSTFAISFNIYYADLSYLPGSTFFSENNPKVRGFYVRCVKAAKVEVVVNRKVSANEVIIGKQVWMNQNLNVDKFRNGDLIFQAKTNEEWVKYTDNEQPAWRYYDNDPANGDKYGKLYNWWAVNDPRGLAPEGYHIPKFMEWQALSDFLGDSAGVKMKFTDIWNNNCPDESANNGTNESGFSGLPGGYCDWAGFNDLGTKGGWWSATANDAGDPGGIWVLEDCETEHSYHCCFMGEGYSVRCLKD